MAQPNGPTQTLTATVEAVNERGIKVNGGWLNVSKFHAAGGVESRGGVRGQPARREVDRCASRGRPVAALGRGGGGRGVTRVTRRAGG
jgi:hypothetical protein